MGYKDDLFNLRIINSKGEEVSAARIDKDNITEIQNRARKYGVYGSLEEGKIVYFTGCGYDYFFVSEDEDKVKIISTN